MSNRTYLAGPMRSLPRFNFDAFHRAAQQLRAAGWAVVSPAELDEAEGFDPDHDTPDEAFMRAAYRRDIAVLLDPETTAIHLLEGWERSGGACLESEIAKRIGLTIYLFHPATVTQIHPPTVEMAS